MIQRFRAYARLQASVQGDASARRDTVSFSPKCINLVTIASKQVRKLSTSTTSKDKNGNSEKKQTTSISEATHQRKHGNKPLPLSSFLSPALITQRHAHRNRLPKPAPPTYQNLPPARQKLARNVYANLLAHPVRACQITDANLPTSLLVKFNSLPDPTPPHALTMVPVALYNDSVSSHGGDKSGKRLLKDRGMAQSMLLNRQVVQFLAEMQADLGGLRDALKQYDAKMGINAVRAIDRLMAARITKVLRWPLSRGAREYVSLPDGLGDLQRLCGEPSAVLFFGGRMLSQEVVDLEARVEDAVLAVDNMLIKENLLAKRMKLRKAWVARADPRVMHTPVELTTVEFVSENDTTNARPYRVPVIPMVDIMGEEAAMKLLKDTPHEGSGFIAVESMIATADHVAKLIACAFWAKDGIASKTGVP